MTDYEWFSLRICLFFLPDTLSLDIGFTVQNPFAADGDVVKLSGLGSYTGRARARSG